MPISLSRGPEDDQDDEPSIESPDQAFLAAHLSQTTCQGKQTLAILTKIYLASLDSYAERYTNVISKIMIAGSAVGAGGPIET